MTDINKIGELAAAKVKSIAKTKANLDKRSRLAAAELSQVWDALEAGTPVNGCATKKDWAAKWKITTRQCNYILRGRKPRTGEHKNRAVLIKPDMVVRVGKRKFTVVYLGDPMTSDDDIINSYGRDIGGVDSLLTLQLKEIDPKPAKVAPKKKEKKEPLRHIKDGIGAVSLCGVWYKNLATPKHPANCKKCIQLQTQPEAPHGIELRVPTKNMVDPQKDLTKRYRAVKRVAKFYCGMMKELTDGVDDNYDRLLNLYADNGWGDRRYPWTVPSVGLHPTEDPEGIPGGVRQSHRRV